MFAFCNAAVVRALLIVAGFVVGGGIRPDAVEITCAGPIVTIMAPAAPDTIRAPKPVTPPKPPSEPVTITITDEGINVNGEGTMKIQVEADRLERELKRLEGLPESLATLLEDEYDSKRYVHVKGSDLVEFGKKITVEADELVNGNVVSIASDIRVDGKVRGDVAAIFGSVRLGPGAVVNGEVVSIFGEVERDEGAVVRGETAVIGGSCGRSGIVYPLGAFGESVIGGVAKIVFFIIGILLMLILLFFIPRRMRAAADYAVGSLPKSGGMGLLLFFGGIVLVAILGIILAITIVGIPVAALLVLSFAALLGIGYSVSALALGAFVTRRFGVEEDSIYLQAVVGLFLLAIFGIVASFMTVSPLLFPARVIIRSVGGILQFVALLVGTGAFVLSRAGAKGGSPAPTGADAATS